MKLKIVPIVVMSSLAFACKKKHDVTSEENQENLKKMASSSAEKPLPSVQSLSSKAFVPDRIFYKFDDASIQDRYSVDLKIQAAYLKAKLLENPQAQIVVEGNCDERGGVEYNIALGHKRANSVKEFLIKEGIPAEKIKTVSFGKERKLVEGTSAIAYLQNRAALTKVESK